MLVIGLRPVLFANVFGGAIEAARCMGINCDKSMR
jgi:hypothetical protein